MQPNLPAADELAYTRLPTVGASIPRRGNRLTRGIMSFLMRLFGWRIVGEVPDLPRFVFVGAPHTSNSDFFMTAFTMVALGVDIHFVMKHTPFVGPLGRFLRWLGGIPIDRDRTRDFVSQMVDEFNKRDKFLLAIMPEGTRGSHSAGKGWRSGFYYIAKGAGVPLLMVIFDYANREMRVGPTIFPGENYEADLPEIQAHFVGVRGRKPERTLALNPTEAEPNR